MIQNEKFKLDYILVETNGLMDPSNVYLYNPINIKPFQDNKIVLGRWRIKIPS